MAPALKVSAAAKTTEYPWSDSLLAILAVDVVFPVPFTPTIMIEIGLSSEINDWTVLSKSQYSDSSK